MDVAAYLSRIGCAGAACATLETLQAVHRAHATSIPFENLDIQLGLPVDLRIAALEDKMVGRRRGGYCFEHNSLAMHALREIGFEVSACEARVRLGATRVAPRTHMVLLVDIGGTTWLWDTGFGGDTPLEPLQLDGTAAEQGGAEYRIVRGGPEGPAYVRRAPIFVVQMNVGNGWTDMYAFAPEPLEPVDFEVANWYTSTHPDSHFVSTLTAQQRTPNGSKVLRNLSYAVTSASGSEAREVPREGLLSLLGDEFGLEFPEGTRFRAIDRAEAVTRLHI